MHLVVFQIYQWTLLSTDDAFHQDDRCELMFAMPQLIMKNKTMPEIHNTLALLKYQFSPIQMYFSFVYLSTNAEI